MRHVGPLDGTDALREVWPAAFACRLNSIRMVTTLTVEKKAAAFPVVKKISALPACKKITALLAAAVEHRRWPQQLRRAGGDGQFQVSQAFESAGPLAGT